jgi:hypothetical protein
MSELTTTNPPEDLLALGQSALRPQDFQPPRVKIVQQMSAENNDGLAKPGDLFNTLTGENFGSTMTISPILPFMQRVMLVRQLRRDRADQLLSEANLAPLSDGDGLKCRSFDMLRGMGEPGDELWADHEQGCNECPLSAWHRRDAGQEAPICSETYNVAAVNDLGELVILSFARSSAKTGKRLFSAIRTGGRPGEAPWTRQYRISTQQTRNDLGTFYVAQFERLRELTPPDLLAAAIAWGHQIKGVRIDVTPDLTDDGTDDTEALATPEF